MKQYRCVEDFEVCKCGEDYEFTDEFLFIDKDSIWQEDTCNNLGSDIQLVDDKGNWLGISNSTLDIYFKLI